MTGDSTFAAALGFLALCGIATALIGIACAIADFHDRGLERLRRHRQDDN